MGRRSAGAHPVRGAAAPRAGRRLARGVGGAARGRRGGAQVRTCRRGEGFFISFEFCLV